jgi:glycosyltransferase involved in cell wall biosynthesis
MKIALVSLYFVEYAIELANALAEKHHVHLILSKSRIAPTIGEHKHLLISPKVACTLLSLHKLRHYSTLQTIFECVKFFFSTSPDVLHLQECANPLNNLFLSLPFKSIVATVHDVNLHEGTDLSSAIRWKFNLMKKMRQKKYDKIIVHGNKLKSSFLNQYNRSPHDVFVIPHGCLFSFGKTISDNFKEEPNTVLFFGRIEKYKGLDYLIKAEPLVSSVVPDFKVIVAGRGRDLERHKTLLDSNPKFEVHDKFIPNERVHQFFERASLIVLPYIEASQSGIAAMAFAFGKPVIATDVGSLAEMVEHNVTGIIAPPKDEKALAKAIVHLLTDSRKRAFLSNNAKNVCQSKFGWSHIAELTENVYLRALASRM